MICGASFKNKGVQPLLDAVVDYLPSPLDIPPMEGINPETMQPETRQASDDEPFTALAFKMMTDPFVGQLTFFRVYSGTLASGMHVYNSTQAARRSAIGRLLRMHANKREEIDEVCAGDIAAVVGLKYTHDRRHALRREHRPIVLEQMDFPEPVISWRSSRRPRPTRRSSAWRSASWRTEDPTFRVRTDEETGQTIISGMGELHLEIIVDRLLREFKVEANVGRPQVAYRETIRREGRGRGRFVRQTGGRGQYGHVVIDVAPRSRARASSSRTRSWAASCRGSTSRPWRRASGRRWRAACSPATRCVDVR